MASNILTVTTTRLARLWQPTLDTQVLCALERQVEESTAFQFAEPSNCNVDGRAVSHASCIRFGCGGPQRRMAWRLQEGPFVQVAYEDARAHSATCVPSDPAAALSTA